MSVSVLRESTELGPHESRVLAHLTDERAELVGPFLANLERGRQGILHRLLLALLREDVGGLSQRARREESEIRIGLPDGRTLSAEVGRAFAFDRLDFRGDLILHNAGRATPITTPTGLLDLIRDLLPVGEPDGLRRFEQFRQELENSAANYTLALAGAEHRRSNAKEAIATLAWVRQQIDRDPCFSPLVFFEQLVVDGHTLHPCSKAKMGMDPADVLRYSPEWGGAPELSIAAVVKPACRVVTNDGQGPTEWLRREHPGVVVKAAEFLEGAGRSLHDYELLPVHPWQAVHTLPTRHAEAIRRGEVVPIPGAGLPSDALVSVRSLAPHHRRGGSAHHLKTPIDIQMTSAVRTVSPASAENGPALSRALAACQEREGLFGGRFRVLREDLGAYYIPDAPSLSGDERLVLSKNLAVVVRENPEEGLALGEIAMPGVALLCESPFGTGPIAFELIERFAQAHEINDPAEAAVRFVGRYAEVALPGFLTLLSGYGVALEGHLQNSVPVFRLDDGEPLRMLVRDLGGVRVLPERLARQGIPLELYPGSAIVADDETDLRNKLFYALFQNHLGELIAAIVRCLDLDERPFWRAVAEVARSAFRSLRARPEIGAQAPADEAALFRPALALKSLATMRLLGEFAHDRFIPVPNPLSEADAAEARP